VIPREGVERVVGYEELEKSVVVIPREGVESAYRNPSCTSAFG